MFRKTYNFETTFRFLRSFPMICNVCSKNWFRCNSRCVLSINMPNWRRGISKSNRKHADLAWCCTSFCHSLNTKTNFQESPYLIFLTEVSMVCNLRMNTFRKSLPSLKCSAIRAIGHRKTKTIFRSHLANEKLLLLLVPLFVVLT